MAEYELDEKDILVLNALEKYGAKKSTGELEDLLNIPARTIRYRLSKMKENDILLSPYAMTYERKLGLGEHILIMDQTTPSTRKLDQLIKTMPPFYWFSPTYGKYNGYVVHSVYTLSEPAANEEIAVQMKKHDLISDYHLFDLTDFHVKPVDFTHYCHEEKWTWEWSQWPDIIDDCLNEDEFKPPITERPRGVDFDAKDLKLLRSLRRNADMTLKELGQNLSLSETQVNRRIDRLENEGVIKGYKCVIGEFGNELLVSCFIQLQKPYDSILGCFYELPFPLYLMMQSPTDFCIRFGLPMEEAKDFLTAFDKLRPHLRSFFFQTQHAPSLVPKYRAYDLYDEEDEDWQSMTEKCTETIQEFADNS
jgi:DNA-binding Lrp family transcriptional regulator